METQRAARDTQLETWTTERLSTFGVDPASRLELIVGDASFRRFWRVVTPQRSFVAMDAPPATENNAQFVRLSRLFRSAGIVVPEVLAYDLDRGFLLVTDLGERLYGHVYGTPQQDRAMEAAFETLLRLQRTGNTTGVIPAYTATRFFDELEIFHTWFVRGLLSLDLDLPTAGRFDEVKHCLVRNAIEQPRVCVHRDFHSRNLLWMDDAVTGVVDFQDALWGPVSYDLASLLRDCYARFPEPQVARWRTRWLELVRSEHPDYDAAQFNRWFDLTAVQRHLKAVGIFARLKLRDGRATHTVYIVPVLDHLIDVCGMYPELAFLGEWLSATLRPAAVDLLGAPA